jgi:dipeptidyl aminopeptidase/acylaminoacyl peptidase
MPARSVAALLVAAAMSACSQSAAPSASSSSSPDRASHDVSPATSPLPSQPFADYSGWLAYQTCGPCGSELDDEIHLVRGDGTDDHLILDELAGRKAHPDFSRDGSRLAFDNLASFEDPDVTYVAAADGSEPILAAPCEPPDCVQLWEPAWSPDGTRIAAALALNGTPVGPQRFGIAIIELASAQVTAIVEHPAADGQDHFPRWSPEGDRLVFWRGQPTGTGVQTAIFVVNTDGSGLAQLTDWADNAGDPDWSPDGSLIVYGTHPLVEFQVSGTSELFTIRPDGTGLNQLTAYGPEGPRATQPRWTPDGSAIVYTRTTQAGSPRTLWVISADGQTDQPVFAESGDIYTHPVVQPVGGASN